MAEAAGAAAAGVQQGGNVLTSLMNGLFANKNSQRAAANNVQLKTMDQTFYNAQRDWMQALYAQNGVPFVPGITNSDSSPLPRYSQQLGSRNVASAFPGIAPQRGMLTDVNQYVNPPLMR